MGRETAWTVPLPEELKTRLAGYGAERVTEGESGGEVYRLEKAGAEPLYLKYGRGRVAEAIADEMARTRWMGQWAPVPRVVHLVAAGEEAWLLMTAVAGVSAYEYLLAAGEAERRLAVRAMGEFLRRLHETPVEACPFRSDHTLRMAEARRNLEEGRVDESDFGEQHEGWTAERVWEKMRGLLPLAAEAVVTHGDYSLGNILLRDGAVAGCIDLGRAGIADRYQDLAILWDNLSEFGAEWQELLLQSYGVPSLDENRLQFHLCLDEFF